MKPVKEWKCEAHGYFESTRPECPYGCTTVVRVHLTPPAIRTSGRTANIDNTLNRLAAHHGMTDISNRNGSVASSVKMYETGGLQAGFAPLGNNPGSTMQQMGFEPDSAFSRVKEQNIFKPPVMAPGSQIDRASSSAFKGNK